MERKLLWICCIFTTVCCKSLLTLDLFEMVFVSPSITHDHDGDGNGSRHPAFLCLYNDIPFWIVPQGQARTRR